MLSIETIKFKCDRCGKCCKHRGDIALTPMDVFQISKYLGCSCEETVRKYTRLSHRHGNFPQVVIQGEGKQSTCIFYDRRIGCKIYPVRPAQCYMFPLVPLTASTDPNPKFGIRECYSKSVADPVPVQEWIRRSSDRYESEKEIFHWYMEILSGLERFSEDNPYSKERIKKLLYCEYDLSKDMEEQIKQNLSKKIFYV